MKIGQPLVHYDYGGGGVEMDSRINVLSILKLNLHVKCIKKQTIHTRELKRSQVEFSKLWCISVLESCFNWNAEIEALPCN